MKQCPQCNLTYGDDMNFCLNDGANLIAQPSPNSPEAKTILSEQPKVEPIKVNIGNTPNFSSVPNSLDLSNQPKPRNRSVFYVVGALILLFLGLAIGGALASMMKNNTANAVANSNSLAVNTNTSNKNSNQVVAALNNSNANSKKPDSNKVNANSNSNVNAKPSPSQTPKPSPSQTPEQKLMCYLDDNGAGGGEVNVRQNCDVADCENDSSTVAGTYPNKTEIEMLNKGTQTANYKWLKVRLVKQNKVVWVASTKYTCDGE